MRIFLLFTCAFGVSFVDASPVVFPDVDNNGYFAVEQVIFNPDTLVIPDVVAEATKPEETVAEPPEPEPKPVNNLSLLAPIAFILKPTPESVKKPESSESSSSSSSSSEEDSDEVPPSAALPSSSSTETVSSTSVSSISSTSEEISSTPSSTALTVKPITKPPCKDTETTPCDANHHLTKDEEEDLKEKAAEVEAEPVILTPGVKK
ncbi:hypothetical protein DMENIID0001_150240 [Sergentomyia squamirostris]